MANSRLGLRTRPGLIYTYSQAMFGDDDANAFILAASITNDTQKIAINTLVLDLKAYGLWSKIKAIYPFVGGTASSHRWNLRDPRSVNGAFYLEFFGGWTHASTGATPNGSTAYADTFYNQTSENDSLNSAHLSYYSRTNSNNTEVEIGVQSPSLNYNLLEIRTAGITYPLINQSGLTSVADANSIGYYIGNRQSSNDIDLWKNGVKIINGTTSSNSLPNGKIYIGAMNTNNTATFYTTKECAFATIGTGLTDTEAANLYTAVQAFQTTLGRQV